MGDSGAFVVGIGMACPLGLRARPALAAMRAGLRRYAEVDDVLDLAGEPARASRLSTLERNSSRGDRAAFFAGHALRESLMPLDARQGARIPVYMALPEPSGETAADLVGDGLLHTLVVALNQTARPVTLSFDPNRCFRQGTTAGLRALRSAVQAIVGGAEDFALVGGADSLADRESVKRWAESNRLLGQRNRDGSLPGEGAAFVLLAARRVLSPNARLARVEAVAAEQQEPFRREVPPNGHTLTAVFGQLAEQFPGRVDVVVSAHPEQRARTQEFSYAYLRNAKAMPEPLRHVSIGAALGDLGAASAVVAMVHAVEGMLAPISTLSAAPIRSALVYGIGEAGSVAGAVFASMRGKAAHE